MTQPNCPPSLQACALRVTRLDELGQVVTGATGGYCTDVLSKLTAKNVIEAGSEIILKNACDAVIVNYKSRDQLKRVDFDLEILTPDPELHELLAGCELITSGGQTIGAQWPRTGPPTDNGVALEVWTKAVDEGGAQQQVGGAWFHWYFPWTYWQLGDRNFENNPMTVAFTGYGVENANAGDGPYGDMGDTIEAMGAWVRTDTLPETQCGYLTVS